MKQIETRQALSEVEFWRDYVARKRPVIVRSAVKNWPALSTWNPGYLRSRFAEKRINVAISATHLHNPYEPGSFKKMVFSEAVNAMLSGCSPHHYIMQAPILSELSSLRDDITIPHFIRNETLTAANLWFGPGRNITPVHYDHGHNLIAQVAGRKKVSLFNSSELYRLYPMPATSTALHISRINIQEPDLVRFPRFSRAERMEGLLEPGDLLFIPVYWWHQLEGIDVNISLNFWWKTPLRDRIISRQWVRQKAGSALRIGWRNVRRVLDYS